MSLLLGKCIAAAQRNVIRLLIPQMKMDAFLGKYFRENDAKLAYDANNDCKEGDWVLLRKLDTQYGIDVDYKVEKVVIKAGQVIDPITSQRSMGYENIEDIERISKLFKKSSK